MGFRSVPIIQSRELCDVAKNARHKLRDKSLVFLCLLLIFGTKKRCASHEEVFFRLCFLSHFPTFKLLQNVTLNFSFYAPGFLRQSRHTQTGEIVFENLQKVAFEFSHLNIVLVFVSLVCLIFLLLEFSRQKWLKLLIFTLFLLLFCLNFRAKTDQY